MMPKGVEHMRRWTIQPHAIDAREFFPQTSYLRRTVRAQTCERGCQSSAAIWCGLIDPPAMLRTLTQPLPAGEANIARGTDTFPTGGVVSRERRIKIHGRSSPGDPFMILRPHLGAFR